MLRIRCGVRKINISRLAVDVVVVRNRAPMNGMFIRIGMPFVDLPDLVCTSPPITARAMGHTAGGAVRIHLAPVRRRITSWFRKSRLAVRSRNGNKTARTFLVVAGFALIRITPG